MPLVLSRCLNATASLQLQLLPDKSAPNSFQLRACSVNLSCLYTGESVHCYNCSATTAVRHSHPWAQPAHSQNLLYKCCPSSSDFSAGVRLRLLLPNYLAVRGLFCGGTCQVELHVYVMPISLSNGMHHVLESKFSMHHILWEPTTASIANKSHQSALTMASSAAVVLMHAAWPTSAHRGKAG